MKYLFPFFLSFWSLSIFACSINFNSKIFLSKSQNFIQGLNFSNCQDETKIFIQSEILKSQGKTRSTNVFENIKPYLKESIQYDDKTIEILNLEGIIQSNFFDNFTKVEINLSSLKKISTDDLIKDYHLSCIKCVKNSISEVVLTLNLFSGETDSYPLNVKSSSQVKVLKIVNSIPAFSSDLKKEWFQEVMMDENHYITPFNDLEKLSYFSTNKPILVGDILKTSDLSPKIMVRAGNKTEIILENQMVKIKTFGISRSNGGYGDLVNIYLPEKNKNYLGKAIGINKVTVEL